MYLLCVCGLIILYHCHVDILPTIVNVRSIETLSQCGKLITTNDIITILQDKIIEITIIDVKYY